MRKSLILAGAAALIVIAASVAHAAMIRINLSNQTMHVTSASGDYTWPISSARSGYVTPRGSYGVQRLETMHYSHKYHNSPMPHSIFFRGGYAIHGTFATASLGAPASHGCIRLSPSHAATLFNIVRSEGARIAITGSPESSTRFASLARRHRARTLFANRRSAEPPLAYAPRYAPTMNEWIRAPAGYGRSVEPRDMQDDN